MISVSENFDGHDVLQQASYAFPPATYMQYLQNSDIQARIGARVQLDQFQIAPIQCSTISCTPATTHAVSSLYPAMWYRVDFMCSSGRVISARTLTLPSTTPSNPWLMFSVFRLHT
ncbi:hypothetical protein EI94DRAFT_717951 [Lactarius quietus]|nr:hypothetical protein EI94DRAFT_717951 [Lactarius quietus]